MLLNQRDRARHARIAREINVRLINEDEDRCGNALNNVPDRVESQNRTRRVVRRTQDQGGSILSCTHEPLNIVTPILVEGNGNPFGVRSWDRNRIGLEGAPRVDDFRARRAHGRQGGEEERRRAGSDADLLGKDLETLGDGTYRR